MDEDGRVTWSRGDKGSIGSDEQRSTSGAETGGALGGKGNNGLRVAKGGGWWPSFLWPSSRNYSGPASGDLGSHSGNLLVLGLAAAAAVVATGLIWRNVKGA